MVRPFRVVVVGKKGENLWEADFLVFAEDKMQAAELCTEAAEEKGLTDVQVAHIKEYRKARIYGINKFGWPDDWVVDLIDEEEPTQVPTEVSAAVKVST